MKAEREVAPLTNVAAERARIERILVTARWIAVGWALLQTALVGQPVDAPSVLRPGALVVAACLAAANVLLVVGERRGTTGRRGIGVATFALDTAAITAYAFLFSYDVAGSQWVIVTFIPIEGAVRWQLRGAMAGWGLTAVALAVLEGVVSADAGFAYRVNSVTFRAGFVLVLAVIVGALTRHLVLERRRAAEALEEVTKSDAWRQRLVSTLAHDVRSPLASIQGAAQFLARLDEPLPEGRETALLDGIVSQSKRIQRLAEDLLDLARQEQGRLNLQPAEVDVAELVDGVLGYLPGSDVVENHVPSGLVVTADPARLEQAIYNLASNAQRYGRPPIIVAAERRNGAVELTVTDHGDGVPSDAVEGLFQPFAAGPRADSVGLGLWIVHTLAEAHDGWVRYEDAPDAGARFRVGIPDAPAPTDP